jgi:hypothetical protein
MQALVRRSDLTLKPDEAVPVMMYFEDSATLAPGVCRPEWSILSLAPSAIRSTNLGPGLVSGWRETNRESIVHGEATRRILKAFPEHAQRNAALELALLAVQPRAAWPKAAHTRLEEIERAWAHVNAVRMRARAMLNAPLPADPTADNLWPRF